jgi:hypothetical protein
MMARQQNTPVDFQRTVRINQNIAQTSGRAGKVVPVTHFHMFAGDSASGVCTIDMNLAEMPRPLLNGVILNAQAWAVPKCAHPEFAGFDDYMHAREGADINLLGANRTPPDFFQTLTGADVTTAANGDLFQKLGLHVASGTDINTDLINAFNLIYNFRLAAHSSKLTRRQYAQENLANSVALPRAFWPQAHATEIVPDYESALVTGAMNLDVTAGQIPVAGIFRTGATLGGDTGYVNPTSTNYGINRLGGGGSITFNIDSSNVSSIYADMAGQNIVTSLADIDTARRTQAFARMRALMAGNDATGFDNDQVILAMLMSGLNVPEEYFKRPMLLDSKMVPFGFSERFSTESANLDDSVSEGMARAMLNINVPKMPCECTVIVTVEVVPEIIHEAQSDEYLQATSITDLPDALRDIQIVEPVDTILNREIDARHSTPGGTYGYKHMNGRWNIKTTRLGGDFYQANPNTPDNSQRQALWLSGIVDPGLTSDHWLCPTNLPHDVFSNTSGDAFECVVRHQVSINGLTQMGDVLAEDNSNYTTVEAA